MRRFSSRIVGRMALAGTLTFMTVGAVLAIGSPAQALPPGCSPAVWGCGADTHSITGTHYYPCENGDIPLAVSIQRYVSPGVWTTVASGTGETRYWCNGSTYLELYKVGTFQFWDHCD